MGTGTSLLLLLAGLGLAQAGKADVIEVQFTPTSADRVAQQLTFKTNDPARKSLKLTGEETISIEGLSGEIKPGQTLKMTVKYKDGSTETCELKSRIDTANEAVYFKHGGILHYVVREMLRTA